MDLLMNFPKTSLFLKLSCIYNLTLLSNSIRVKCGLGFSSYDRLVKCIQILFETGNPIERLE